MPRLRDAALVHVSLKDRFISDEKKKKESTNKRYVSFAHLNEIDEIRQWRIPLNYATVLLTDCEFCQELLSYGDAFINE
jgi:hypothetical protein